MELRHLRYFVAVAERLSFTQAAAKVHVAQSTLSHQIKHLEEELGQQLFARVGKRLMLTESGSIFSAHAAAALREVDNGLLALRNVSAQLKGEVRIGAAQSFCMRLIPQCVASFRTTHPSVRIVIEEVSAAEIDSRLQADQIDLAVAYRPYSASGATFEPLYNEEMVLVVSAEHVLAKRRRVRMVELHNLPLAMLSKGFATRTLLDEHFKALRIEPDVAIETTGIATLFAVVREMKIAAIVSEYPAQDAPGLIAVPLEGPTPLRTFGLIWKRNAKQPAAVESFAAVIRRMAHDAKLRKPTVD
jgi:LysR family transcriptional regulator, cyn operon transcriptional activator